MTVETKRLPQPEFYDQMDDDFKNELIRSLTENIEILVAEIGKLQDRVTDLEASHP